jgi:chromosome segregation ATPase
LRIEELEREILALTSSGHNHSSIEVESLRKLLESEKLDKENIQRSAEEKTRVNQEHLDHALEESESLKEKLENLLMEKRSAEARAAELERAKTILEGNLAALEEENMRISDRVSGLELQLKYMTEERDLRQQEAGVVEEEKSYLLSERERLQTALDSTTEKHQDLVRHLTEELDEAIKECEVFKNSQHHFEQEVMRLQGELEEAHHDLREHTKIFENSRAMLEESFHSISKDHANAVAVSMTLEAQVAQLQSDLEDMEMRSATEFRTLSMLKESEQQRAEKAEQALQQSALLQKENSALVKRVAELELLLEDERASYAADTNGKTTSNGHRKSNKGHEAYEVHRCLQNRTD